MLTEREVLNAVIWAAIALGGSLIAVIVWGVLFTVNVIREGIKEQRKFRHWTRNYFGWHELRIYKVEDKLGMINTVPRPTSDDE